MLYAGGLKNGDLCTTRDLLTQKAGESNEKYRNGKRKKMKRNGHPLTSAAGIQHIGGNLFFFTAKVYILGAQNGTTTTVFQK